MNRLLLLILLIVNTSLGAYAQRVYDLCDSTTYEWAADSSFVVGRSTLYVRTGNSLTTRYQFPLATSDHFVSDFEMIEKNLWYAVVSKRYIGDSTTLFRSIDQGISWQVDTSFYPAAKASSLAETYNSINQLQRLGTDTIVLFIGYYRSGVVYSTDGGETWTEWFNNLISYYHGMISCADSIYMFGFDGDGFNSSMVGFARSELFSSDYVHRACHGGNVPGCIYAPSNIDPCERINFYKQYVASICPEFATSINTFDKGLGLFVYPNPTTGSVTIDLGQPASGSVMIIDILGQVVEHMGFDQTDLLHINMEAGPGVYFVVIQTEQGKTVRKLLVE